MCSNMRVCGQEGDDWVNGVTAGHMRGHSSSGRSTGHTGSSDGPEAHGGVHKCPEYPRLLVLREVDIAWRHRVAPAGLAVT